MLLLNTIINKYNIMIMDVLNLSYKAKDNQALEAVSMQEF